MSNRDNEFFLSDCFFIGTPSIYRKKLVNFATFVFPNLRYFRIIGAKMRFSVAHLGCMTGAICEHPNLTCMSGYVLAECKV